MTNPMPKGATHVFITVKLVNPDGKHRDYKTQDFPIDLLPPEELSPTADKIVRAACQAVGVKLPKLEVRY